MRLLLSNNWLFVLCHTDMKYKGSKEGTEDMGLKWFIPAHIFSLELLYSSAYVNVILRRHYFHTELSIEYCK